MVVDKFILRSFIVYTFNHLDDQSYLLSTDMACLADKHVDMITLHKIKKLTLQGKFGEILDSKKNIATSQYVK